MDRFRNWQMPKIVEGQPNEYNWIVQNINGLQLGNMTDIGAFSYINALNGVTIKDNVQIGSHCSIYSVSTIDDRAGEVILKHNCRVGSHTTILPGVSIGRNSIIGAHSLVNENIPDNVIAFGVPAKVVRQLNSHE